MPLDDTGPSETPDEISVEELIRGIGEGLLAFFAKHPDRLCHGATTVEAFARVLGLTIRVNALPGQHGAVMQTALESVHDGYRYLSAADFIGERPDA